MINKKNFTLVLHRTSHSGNLGSAARAMVAFGFAELRIANARCEIDQQAIAQATFASSELNKAKRYTSFDKAIADCNYCVGLSARVRKDYHAYNLRQGINMLLSKLSGDEKVAFIFGNEQSGLSNTELAKCQAVFSIGQMQTGHSLNLAQALQVVCYELDVQLNDEINNDIADFQLRKRTSSTATAAERERLYSKLAQLLADYNFPCKPSQHSALRHVQQLISDSSISSKEIQMFRGMLKHLDK